MVFVTCDKSILMDKGLNFLDMHHHSTVSDGNTHPDQLAKAFLKGGRGLCLTDHNQIRGSMILSKQKGLFTIPSIELTSSEGKDILAYFYSAKDMEEFYHAEIKGKIRDNKLFNLNRTAISNHDMLDLVDDYNGISVLAHPLAIRPKRSIRLLKDPYFYERIHGIEACNYQLGKFRKTARAIRKYDKPLTAGSDSHTVSQFESLTGTYGFDVEDFLAGVLKQKSVLYYKRKLPSVRGAVDRSTMVRNNMSVPRPNIQLPRISKIRMPSRPRFFYKR